MTRKESNDVGKNPMETIIFTFCFNPNDQTMTFAGNVNIIEAARLLQNKVFDSITLANNEPPAEDDSSGVKNDV